MSGTLVKLDGLLLPAGHPFAGREAYQCTTCHGISYPPRANGELDHELECPYCNEGGEG